MKRKRDTSRVAIVRSLAARRSTVNATNQVLTVLIFVSVMIARIMSAVNLVLLNTCSRYTKKRGRKLMRNLSKISLKNQLQTYSMKHLKIILSKNKNPESRKV